MQFTDIAIRAIKPPEAGHTYVWDDTGLGLRVSAKGTKTFCVLIGSGRRQTIGRYAPKPYGISLAEARAEAKRVISEKNLGRVRPVHTAFDDAKVEFLADRAKTLRPRTLADHTRLLGKHYPYGRMSLSAITPRMILGHLKPLPKAERQHAFAAGRVFFRFCVTNRYAVVAEALLEGPVYARCAFRSKVITDSGGR